MGKNWPAGLVLIDLDATYLRAFGRLIQWSPALGFALVPITVAGARLAVLLRAQHRPDLERNIVIHVVKTAGRLGGRLGGRLALRWRRGPGGWRRA